MFELFRPVSKYFNLLPCPVCLEGDGGGRNDLCPDCAARLKQIDSANHCPGCGGTLDGALAICRKCLKEPKRPFADSVALCEYQGEVKSYLWRFKRGGEVAIGRALAELAATNPLLGKWDFELLVPLPLHWFDLYCRSFNQSQIIAQVIAKRLGKTCESRALIRTRRTKKQKLLQREARHRNVAGAFKANPQLVSGRRILLVDDVFTTGATLSAAAKSLLEAGALKVYVLSLARA